MTGARSIPENAQPTCSMSEKPLQRRGSMGRCNTAPLYCTRQHRSTCLTPCQRWGAAKSGWGKQRTRHLQHFVRVLHVEHGKLLQGWQGRWEVRKGANAFLKGPMPSSATQMKEKRRKGRSSPKTGKPSARWARGVKEDPTGEGP